MHHFPARSTAALLLAALSFVAAVGSPPPAAAATATVRITERLEPATISVAPGTTVVWRNESGNRHRMRSVDHSGDRDWDTGDIEPGASASVTFSTPGTFPYVDERDDDDAAFHGTVVVRAAADGTRRGGTPGATPGGGTTPTPKPAPAGSAAPPPGSATVPATATVSMAGRTFSPAAVTIAAGGTVTFRNDDDDEHTATATDAGWDSGVLVAGTSFDRRFPAPGTFSYLCLIHPDMQGTIRVTGAGARAPGTPPAGEQPAPPAVPTPPPSAPAPPSPSSPTSRIAGGPAATVDVAMVDAAFEPARVEIEPGTTVRWTNRGRAPHTATAEGGAFDSGFVGNGGTFATTLDTPGTYSYVCQLHPGMAGSIVVAGGARSPTGTGETPSAASASASPSPSSGRSTAASEATSAPVAAAGGTGPPVVPGPGDDGAASRSAGLVAEQETGAAAARPSADLGRLALVVLLVGSAMVLFGRIVRSTVRPT